MVTGWAGTPGGSPAWPYAGGNNGRFLWDLPPSCGQRAQEEHAEASSDLPLSGAEGCAGGWSQVERGEAGGAGLRMPEPPPGLCQEAQAPAAPLLRSRLISMGHGYLPSLVLIFSALVFHAVSCLTSGGWRGRRGILRTRSGNSVSPGRTRGALLGNVVNTGFMEFF